MNAPINSKEYWEERFKTDWEDNHGREQTRFFYSLLTEILPSWLRQEVKDKQYNILDWGCALGDGTALLKSEFQKNEITGLDIAEEAVKNAQAEYPACRFVTSTEEKYDVVVSSNCLEHFVNYKEMLTQLFVLSKQYVIVLVPFQEENPINEHVSQFSYNSFHIYEGEYVLCHHAEVDTTELPDTKWLGKQILLVYTKKDNPELSTLPIPSLSTYHPLYMQSEKHKNSLDRLSQQIVSLDEKISKIEEEKEVLKDEKATLDQDLIALHRNYDALSQEMKEIKSSLGWKFLIFVWKIIGVFKIGLFINAIRFIKQKGLIAFMGAIRGRIKYIFDKNILSFFLKKKRIEELKAILKKHRGKKIIISPVLVDWNIPLFQRPQQVAIQMAKNNILYFYSSGNAQFDNVKGFQEVQDGCYLTDQYNLITEYIPEAVIHMYSTDLLTQYSNIEHFMRKGHKILYEYIDEIHEDISGFIPMHVLEKHRKILNNEEIYVVATADKLYQDALKHRNKNCILVTNGVDPNHYDFAKYPDTIPETIQDIVEEKKPIIGYFGAFASWFDYELVKKCAEAHPDWNLLLLGWDYDGTLKEAGLDRYSNIRVLGPINYKDLPLYAKHFTVSTIPFLINDVTESTSPVKLFEYMSMRKPIVTTDMPECRKYKSVYIGTTHKEYIQKIEEGLKMKENEEYMNLLEKEARENSWFNKAKQIVDLIHSS